MDSTPVSLLERLRRPAEQAAWERFVRLYTPLLCQWARRLGLRGADAADLVQDVFVVLVQKLPEFRYDPRRRFRGWLWTVTLNKWRERRRRAPSGGRRPWRCCRPWPSTIPHRSTRAIPPSRRRCPSW